MELLACLAAGEAEVPFLSRKQALTRLAKLVASLRQDRATRSSAPEGCW